MNSVVGSSAGGMTEADGRRRWPPSSKYERKPPPGAAPRSSASRKCTSGACRALPPRRHVVGRREISCRSASRLAAASLAVRIASLGSRFFFSEEMPWAIPAATPDTFSTGLVIAKLTARTAVSALSAIETALSVTTSALSSWWLDPVDRSAGLDDHRSRSRSVPETKDERRPNVPPSLTSMYAVPRPIARERSRVRSRRRLLRSRRATACGGSYPAVARTMPDPTTAPPRS